MSLGIFSKLFKHVHVHL